MAEGFTFPNVRICTQAIAEEVFSQKNHNKPFIVGYDTRFLSEHFAREAAQILANNGIEVFLSNRDVPTPVVACEIIRVGAGGAINITASHNPFDYNGLKYSTDWGGPAIPEITRSVENFISLIIKGEIGVITKNEDGRLAGKLIQETDFRPHYLKHIKHLLDPAAFRGHNPKIIVDVLFGTSRGYLADILQEMGCQVEVIHNQRDVLFGGKGPDPSEAVLEKLIQEVRTKKADLGLACDGDADRFAVVDAGGYYLTPNDILPLLARYLVQSRGWKGIIARSVMTTHGVDAVARKFGLEIKETPVGFKHIGEIMKEADSIMPSNDGEFVMGAEESGGFTMRGHIPEKDGILACLLVAEMVASSHKTVRELIQSLHEEVGAHFSKRINFEVTPDHVNLLKERFGSKPPTTIDGLHVQRIVDIDGYKFIFFGGAWLGVRFSGTEPVIRLYLEGNSQEQLNVLAEAGKKLLDLVVASKDIKKANY